MNCSEFRQQKNLQRTNLKKAVAKHSAKLKAKYVFPLLPSTTYTLDKSQSVSISKPDADIYTSKRRTERQPCEIRGKELEDMQWSAAFRIMETWHSFVDEQTNPTMSSNAFLKSDKEKQGVKELYWSDCNKGVLYSAVCYTCCSSVAHQIQALANHQGFFSCYMLAISK